MMHLLGVTILTLFAKRSPAISIFFVGFPGSFLNTFYTLISSHTYFPSSYCDVVWFRCTKSDSHCLDLLLNFSCRTVLRRRKYSSASSARSDLGINTLPSRRKVHVAQTVFKCLSSNCPSYLSSIFPPPPTSSHITHSNTFSQLNLLPTRPLALSGQLIE